MAPLTAEQLSTRRRGLGSSDIAAILGEDPHRSPLDVWLDKLGKTVDEPSEFTRLGNRMEEIVADEFAEQHRVRLRRCGTMVHSEIPYVLATPDRRIVGVREGVECKNVGWRMLHHWRCGDGWTAPTKVILQAQWQCIVTGWDAVWVAACLGGRDRYEQRVEADSDIGSMLLDAAADFWRLVEKQVQPEPGPSEAARKILARTYPGASLPVAKSTPEVEEIVRSYSVARAAERAAKQAKNAAANRLCQVIGDRAGFVGEWGQATWVARGKGRTAWAKVAAELHPSAELISKHTTPPARTLRVDVVGEDSDDGD